MHCFCLERCGNIIRRLVHNRADNGYMLHLLIIINCIGRIGLARFVASFTACGHVY